MPNWCYNETYFRSDDPARVDELEAVCRAYEKDDTNDNVIGPFQFLYPMPNPIEIERTPLTIVHENGEREIRENTIPDWWLWRNSHWGTKWEPSCLEVERISPNELRLQFDTAWGPPIGIYERAYENGWAISASYSEPNMGFEGEWSDGIDDCRDIEMTEEEGEA